MSKQIVNSPVVLTEAQFKAREEAGTLTNGVYQIIEEIESISVPALPSTSADGTYVLKAVKSGTTITYSWVLES